MKRISLILILILTLWGCGSGGQLHSEITIPDIQKILTPQPAAAPPAPAANGSTISIASFNIQVFGKTKAGKPEVMTVLAQTIHQFDIVAIQEIRDSSGTAIEKLEAEVDALGTDYGPFSEDEMN